MPTPDQMVVAAAQAGLRPLGLRRHRRTRLWFEDRGWWLLLVEFERAGTHTHLRVGAKWLWGGPETFGYDRGGRLFWRAETGDFAADRPDDGKVWTQSIQHTDDAQFATGLAQLVDIAGRRAAELRQEFATPADVAATLTGRQTRAGQTSWWHVFHAGAAAGLSGDAETARQQFDRIRPDRLAAGWEQRLHREAAALSALAGDPKALRDRLLADIHTTRAALSLPPVEAPLPA